MSKLIGDWLLAQHIDVESEEYEGVSWAVDELFDLATENPDDLLPIIVDILEVDSSEKTLGALGAGALEELLVHHGDAYIDKVVELAKENENFKSCLRFTFVDRDDVSEAVYERFMRLKGA